MLTTSKEYYPGGFLARLGGLALAAATAIGLTAGMASAAGTVQWNNPADGTVFDVGTEGSGLDLALVLDGSGSMSLSETSGGVTKTRAQWQADAAIALVNSLPSTGTAVAVIEFDSSASVVLSLTPTTSSTDIVNAINGVSPGGSTAIGTGIQVAQTELLGPNGTAGASKQMVVISDGQNNVGINPVTAATTAAGAGITVHGVSIPGTSTTQMQNIASAGGGAFVDFSNPDDLQDIEDFFSGAGGSFVGVDQVDIEMPDGTVLSDVPVTALGNFKTPGWNIVLGDNVFTATAFFEDGSSESATLTLVGQTAAIPLPAAGWLLLSGLAGLGLARRARRNA